MSLVSIIVPVYKTELTLKKCLDSIIGQTLKNIEIILVNDGSPDNAGIICNNYAKLDSRIKVIHKENGGLSSARNAGIEIANGEYIGFVDSDDFIDLTMYEKLLEEAKKENADCCYCNYYNVFDNQKSIAIAVNEKKVFTNEQCIDFLMDLISSDISYKDDTKYGATVWKAIFKRSIIIEHNIRFYSERKYISEDGLFDIDFMLNVKKICYIPECLYYYIYNPDSLTTTYINDKFLKNKALYLLQYEKLKTLNRKDILIQLGRSLIVSSRVSIIQEVIVSKEKKSIRKRKIKDICKDSLLQKVIREYPWKKLTFKKRIFTFLVKHKMVSLIIFLTKKMYRGGHNV